MGKNQKSEFHLHTEWHKILPASIRILLLIFLSGILAGNSAFSQQVKITGVIKDGKSGENLPGVNIQVEGTVTGAISGADGSYLIETDRTDGVLQFSFIGYVSQKVQIAGSTVVNVSLMPEDTRLEEVVVIGYSTQKKVNLTGAVTTVDAENITVRPIIQTSTALQGLAPGVLVTQNLGTPGNDASTIRIRGIGSISSDNSPLILVDGIQITNINDVNAEDIESISVLKDAASASIYGARAANGVILITTRRGEKGRFSVNADFSYGVQMPTMLPDFVGVDRQMLYEDVKRLNEGSPIEWGVDAINDYRTNIVLGANDQYQNNDWYDAVVKPAAGIHRQQFVVSGGTDKITGRMSMVNMNQDGLLANSSFNRKSLRSNLDFTPLAWLSFSTDLFIQRSEKNQPPASMTNIFQMINELEPYRQLYVGDRLWGWAWRGENPLAFTENGGLVTDKNNYNLINLNAKITPFAGLSIDMGYSNLTDNNQITRFTEKFAFYEAGAEVGDPPQFSGYNPTQNSMNMTSQYRSQNYYKATVSYEKTFGLNYLKILAGGDAIEFQYSDFFGSRNNFPLGQAYPQLSLGDRDGINNGSSGNSWAMASVLGRVNYILRDRYLFEASARYDGSSRFASENRFGFFPSLSAGWRISEEPFMAGIDVIDNLKLRASWGKLGNQNIGSNYPYQSLVDLSQASLIGETSQLGAAITEWAVRDISWEKSQQINFGVDFGLFSNRLSGSIDYYNKTTSNILLILALPQSSGLAPNYQNGAEMINKGWEAVVNWKHNIGMLDYYITGQIDDNKNKITSLLGTGPYISNDRIRAEGEEFDALYGWESAGFLSKEDLTDVNVPKQASSKLAEGSLKFKDQDGNGVIDINDRVIIGSEMPRFNYSISAGTNYKGIGLDMILQGVGKRNGYVRRTGQSYGDYLYEWESDFYLPADHQVFTSHHYDEVGLVPNTTASLPAIGSDNGNFSDFWIKSRAYLRIKNVTLSYSIPERLVQNVKLQTVRLYVSGENLYTFTKFIKGFDPEMSSGRGYWQYPNISKIIGGINISF